MTNPESRIPFMENPEDTGPDSRNAMELKKELEKLIKLILKEDDYKVQELNKAICILSSLKEKNARGNETTDEAIRVVSSLRELKIKESVPKEFKRPMSGEIMGDPVVVASGQLSQARNVGIVVREGHSNDIRVAEEKEKFGGKCKEKEKVTSTSKGRENAIQVEEDVSVVQSIPLPCYDVVDRTNNGVYTVSSGYESALSIGQQGSGRRMERGEPSTRNEDRRVRKKEEDVTVVQSIPLPCYDVVDHTKNGVFTVSSGYESALSIGQQGSVRRMERWEPSTRNEDRRVRKKTYNRPSIEKCFRQVHKTRPKTKQELSNSLLTPNNLLKNIIDSLLDKMMSSSLSDQKSSAKTLRQLTKQYPPFRNLFGNEAVSKLLKPLDVPGNASLDLDLQLDIITTVFNISLPKGNKKVVAENLRVIPLLINALRTGTSQTKSNAAAALFNLSEFDSNRTLIHESGALGPLIRLVGEGNSETMTDVCAAMYMLCWDGANTDAHREKAVSDGAVRVILRKDKDGDFLDLLLPVLATLSSLPSAAEEMGKMGAVACLLKIMIESGDEDSNAAKSCAAILFDIYSFYKQEEASKDTISSVALRPEGDSKGPG